MKGFIINIFGNNKIIQILPDDNRDDENSI